MVTEKPQSEKKSRFNFWSQLSESILGRGRVSRLARNVFLDLRYGGKFLGGAIASSNESKGYWHMMNTDYRVLDFLFSHLTIASDQVITDIGCGKGRVINYFLHQGIENKLVGIEVDEKIADFTQKRLRKYQQVKILKQDLFLMEEIPGDIFYLFNPFSHEMTQKFSERVKQQWQRKQGKKPVVVYNNAIYSTVFEGDSDWDLVKKIPVVQGSRHGAAIFRLK